ncbi:hypothetical protein BS50DRAFT_262442 [Corynespora cassiicola Philippines]|uniref:PNPLA domain-containing protein n=1 Tax=Corynespora cassiicola Philippines TaxID=1448308 RepID=A0A2T2N174_CORCC|nr:hypothetical protein BS50DRAFT_262442 [Corynespora cassiicola Philippines]
MPRLRNVLVLKGDLLAADILNVLEELLKRVGDRYQHTPCLRELFSFVCGSGTSSLLALLLGRLKMNIEECRTFLDRIERRYRQTHDFPSSLAGCPGFRGLGRHLESVCDASQLFQDESWESEEACHV